MIITIARQYGCGALAIGKMLGAAYGIPFYTRKGLLEMARAEGVLEEMDDFFEERPVDELLFAISALGHSEGPVHSRALDILSDMIGQRNCIIIGRCGNYIFYHRYYTHLQWGNSSDYDLCFDSVRLGAERSVALIRQYIEGIGIK